MCTGFCWGNLRVRDHWGDPDVDGSIILRWIFRKWEGVVGTIIIIIIIIINHSFIILSDDRFKASSKTIPPHSAI